MDRAALGLKAAMLYLASLLAIGAALFLTAGTLDYWQAWLYMAVIFVPMPFVGSYLLRYDPELLERRFRVKEKEAEQKTIQKLAIIPFLLGFLVPGFDRRFGWSGMPFELAILANALALVGYAVIFLAFRENSYAARTVEVEKGQKVVSTGPYSIIRHPMYLGVLILYLATPIALGSYWALIPFLVIIPALVLRTLNEEEVLLRDLPGYEEYCGKTRYRLVPFVW